MTIRGHAQINTVLAYHERTKHHPNRYAASLGYLDWDTQPNPLRRFEGAELLLLDEVPPTPEPSYGQIFLPDGIEPRPLDRASVSQLFYDSLALSAWKAFRQSRWSLRVNPSSGNLHPTEGYLIAGPVDGLSNVPALYHYAPYEHGLEQRRIMPLKDWRALTSGLPDGSFLVGLTSIYWREAWKYGERAFRYCQHDAGHAIGAVALAGSALGWQASLLEGLSDDELTVLLGIGDQEGIEAEHADCLMVIWPRGQVWTDQRRRSYRLPSELLTRLRQTDTRGRANSLSMNHHHWPIIDEISGASRRVNSPPAAYWDQALSQAACESGGPARSSPPAARQIFRQRRSALAMDGQTHISAETFFGIMQRVVRKHSPVPFGALPWPPQVALALFVHRVEGLTPGLYLLVRDQKQESSLRRTLTGSFKWIRPEGCPSHLNLYLLQDGDCRRAAKTVSCHQDIASDGAFALSMLACFEPPLQCFGPWFYRQMHWEAGVVGQVLYLEAEAVLPARGGPTIGSTGIGCFFDDTLHRILGIRTLEWQDLYHFTIGGPVEDSRLQSIPAYAHLRGDG